MIERPLMTGDELRTLPKGSMLVTKTSAHPVITQMQLYTKWGITFDSEPYMLQDKSARPVKYVSEQDIAVAIISKNRRDMKKAITTAPPQFRSEAADETKALKQQPSVKSPQNPLHNQRNNPLRTD